MKKTTIIGIIFTIIVGALLHFAYQWSGNNSIVALVSAVNESTWEHLKLLFFPYLIYMLFEYHYIGHGYPNYFTAKAIGVLSGLFAIPIIFNLYTAILGTNYLVPDILTFVIGVIISYLANYYILKQESIQFNLFGIAVIIILMLAFFAFTFNPPLMNLFLDPVTNAYGVAGNSSFIRFAKGNN